MKTLKIFAIITGTLFLVLIIAASIIGRNGPDTSIYLGRQIPKNFMNEINTLGLLESEEEIKYFYSDGFTDIKSGFYFLTDKNLVIYSDMWETPETVIDYDDITSIEFERNTSFLEDSYIKVKTNYGLEMEFPVSSERDRDTEFFQYIADHSLNSVGNKVNKQEP